ncbi:MAG TPA: hypothetical protein VNT33_02285 [Telluria sp.]|nr:hypothetical protein [Telluria sp.]
MNKRLIAGLLSLPLALANAYAQEAGEAPSVKISGFGTGALTWANTDNAQFGRSNQFSGAGKDARTGVDSNLGLQADLPVNSWLSLTAQGLVRKDAEDDYGAELAWAFAKARLSDQLNVRVGRMGLPVFMISDYRNVGYANTMLRPPIEMYSQVPFNSVDGADVTWQRSFGATTFTAQFAVGVTKPTLAGGYHLDAKAIRAINLLAEHGPLTLRLGRADAKFSINDSPQLNTLLASLRTAGAGYKFTQLPALADAIAVDHKKGSFTSAGLGLDWNDVVVQSEYARRKTDSYINDTTSWYVMGGYRIGKFLPYAVHATTRIDSAVANTVPAACPAGYPAACTPTMQALSAGVARLRNTGNGQGEQTTNSVGVRWDFYRSVALKVQFDRVKPKNGNGLFIQPKPGFAGPVTVGAVALDFVF